MRPPSHRMDTDSSEDDEPPSPTVNIPRCSVFPYLAVSSFPGALVAPRKHLPNVLIMCKGPAMKALQAQLQLPMHPGWLMYSC